MATRIIINIVSNPLSGSLLKFNLNELDLSYSKSIVKTFVSGVPLFVSQVQIGATAEITLSNLFSNLQSTADSNMVLTEDYPNIYIDFEVPGGYTAAVLQDADGAFEVGSELLDEPVIDPEVVLDYKDFSIEIIDTYDNDRPLIEEFTRVSAPQLTYESGDDIYEPLMTSELKFDMRVADSGDAHFLHLFTADETRYKVKLNAIDEEENVSLIWQGFLLPDLLKEPYVKGNLFVEFLAIDMISTLKNKFFWPWEYYRKINVMRLFSEILKKTGINQSFIVKPSVVPADVLTNWWALNLELEVYADDNGGKDVYTILNDVLAANLLTLYSYKGTWYIEGVTRKIELDGAAYFFDENGVYQYSQNVERVVQSFDFQKDTLNFNAMTPWKTVALNFTNKGENNLFSEDVVDREAFFGIWNLEKWDETSQKTSYLNSWNKIGAPFLEFKKSQHKFYFGNTAAFEGSGYVVSESSALVNYFECKEMPYVYPGVEYFLKMECEVELDFVVNPTAEAVLNNLDNGFFDNILIFMLLVDDVEIKSNRPSNINGDELIYVRSYGSRIPDTSKHTVKFSLENYFEVQNEGYLSFRFLAPISTGGLNVNFFIKNFVINPTVLKIEADKDYDNVSDFKGIRSINYTSKLSLDVNFTCVANKAVKNSFGLGMQILPYEMNVPVGTQSFVSDVHTFPNGGTNELKSWRFIITADIEKLLFKDLLSKACYLTRLSGFKQFFNSIYTNRNFASLYQPALYYLTDKVGRPKYPKTFQFIDKIESGETITMLLSNYPAEDYSKRQEWKVYGETKVADFRESIVDAAHYVRPEQLFWCDGGVLGIVFPGELINFYFAEEDRKFVQSRISIDLYGGKTTITGREVKYEVLNDISYD